MMGAKEALDAKRYSDEAKRFKKDGGRLCRAEGGRAIGLREDGKLVGAGGAAGRLAKLKMYGK